MQIGLIGCGRIADGHMIVYRHIKNAKVVVASDVNLERAKMFAAKNRINKVFNDYSELLEVKDLDFIDVCTPPSTHARIACDAAEFGHNVLLEKPMALTTDECENIIHAVEKHRVSLCICHNQKFFPAMRKAKHMVGPGNYDVVSFRTSIKENPEMFNVPAWNATSKEGGIIWEVGCHPAYLHLYLLDNIKEVYAVGSKVKYPVFDEFSVLLRTSGKAYGIIEVSWLSRETEKIYEIESSDGRRVFMIAPPPYANEGYDVLLERSGIAESSLYSDVSKILRHFTRKVMPLGYFIGHFHLINAYIKSLAKGSPSPVQPEEGKRAIKLLECIERSLNTHKIVSVE